MKYLLLSLLVTTCIFASSFQSFQKSKQKHFAYSLAIASVSTTFAKHNGKSKLEAYLYGAKIAVGISILKELVNGKSLKHVQDTQDIENIYADILGAVTVSLLTYTWRW